MVRLWKRLAIILLLLLVGLACGRSAKTYSVEDPVGDDVLIEKIYSGTQAGTDELSIVPDVSEPDSVYLTIRYTNAEGERDSTEFKGGVGEQIIVEDYEITILEIATGSILNPGNWSGAGGRSSWVRVAIRALDSELPDVEGD